MMQPNEKLVLFVVPVLGYEDGYPPWLTCMKTKEGFLMVSIPHSSDFGSNNFQRILDTFLSQRGLPFADVLSAGRIEQVFAEHGSLFGVGAIYSTAVMVWSFLGQVLRDGKEASCQSAVARVVIYCQQQQTATPTVDTGDYCKARAKLSEAALRSLTR